MRVTAEMLQEAGWVSVLIFGKIGVETAWILASDSSANYKTFHEAAAIYKQQREKKDESI